MKRVTLTETKDNLAELVERVQNGETILIVDRGRPVARLASIVVADDDDEARLERLERQGILRRGSGRLPSEILKTRPPKPSPGGSALAALLAERREGR